MTARDLSRLLLSLGIIVLIVAFVWWFKFYGDVTRGHQGSALKCLIYTDNECGVVVGVAALIGVSVYTPTIFWIGAILTAIGGIGSFALTYDQANTGTIALPNWIGILLVGFIAGALSVLIFHQLGFWLSNEFGFTRAQIYNMKPVPPWKVPTIISSAFWGGLWGVAAAFVVPRLPGALSGVLGWILFAAIVVSLVNWFVVFPIKGQPMGGGFRLPGVVVVPIVYAFWGFGMWVFARLLRTTLSCR